MRSAAITCLALILAACAPAGGRSTSLTTGAAATTATAPPLVLSSERITAPEGVRAWDVRYRSETIGGEPTEVTGWIAIPDARQGMPILAWAHPTEGLADECAPSTAGGLRPHHFADVLEEGWAVIATDYEGLGGPGLHPYLVGESEARSIFDLARAAREIEPDVGTTLMLWGFSQGGHAVLSAGGLAAEIAPDFDIVGIAAVAPAVDLIGWPTPAMGTSQQGYIAAIVAAYAETYDLDPADILTPRAIELLDEVEETCSDPTFYAVAGMPASEVFVADPSTVEPWRGLLVDNSPELHPIEAPVLLVVGSEDSLWDIELLDVIVDRMCGIGTEVATSIHLDEDHGSINGAAIATTIGFLTDRLAGEPFDSDC